MYIVGEQLELDTNILIKEFCKQCLKHQDGIEHMCGISGPDDPFYDSIYDEALQKIDIGFVKALLYECGNMLHLDVSLLDFDVYVKDCIENWRHIAFRKSYNAYGGQFVLRIHRALAYVPAGRLSEEPILTDSQRLEIAREKITSLTRRCANLK